MRILVTGGSGFVGGHLQELLRQRGDQVVAWGLKATGNSDVQDVDLRDGAAVAANDLTEFDAVIHLAGRAEVGRSFSEPSAYICDNSAMQIHLFEALLRQQAFPRILVTSSGAVYGGAPGLISETSPVDPTSPYAVSKLTQEMLAAYYGKRGLEVIVARPFNHIGPGQQRGYLVADVASQIAEAERTGHGTLTVGDLSSKRDYTDVRDIAAAYVQLIENGKAGETYNVCSGVSRSGEEMVDALLELTSADVEVVRSAFTRPTDASVVTASSSKLERDTGWSPTIPLQRTLSDTLDYWRELSSAA